MTIPSPDPLDHLEQTLAELRTSAPISVGVVDVLNELADHQGTPLERKLALGAEAVELARRLSYTRGLIYGLVNLSKAYGRQARTELIVRHAMEALALLETTPDPHLEAHARARLVTAYRHLRQYGEMLSYGMTAIELYRQVGDRYNEAETIVEIALGYPFLGETDKAFDFFDQALQIHRADGNLQSVARVLNNIAYTHLLLGNYQQAHAAVQESLQYHRDAHALDTMAEVMLRLGDLDAAERYEREAQQANRFLDGSTISQDLEAAMGVNFARIAKQRGAYDQARAFYEEAIAVSVRSDVKQVEVLALRELTALHEEQGAFQQALETFKRVYTLEQEIFNAESNQKLRTLQVLHETETARREAALFQQENLQLARTQAELQSALQEVERRAEAQAVLLQEIEHQRQTILELSLPVLPLTREILVMPLIGTLDEHRLQQLQEEALTAVARTSAVHVLLDITGVPTIDATAAQGIMAVVQATKLLGAHVILVGIRPEVAQSLISLGLDLRGIESTADLQSALALLSVLKPESQRDSRDGLPQRIVRGRRSGAHSN